MKRIILFPIWNVDELEKKLCEFEKKDIGLPILNIHTFFCSMKLKQMNLTISFHMLHIEMKA